MARPAVPTQMIIIPINETLSIDNLSFKEGKTWAQILNIFEKWSGFRRLYWGRHVEERDQVHLHIGKCCKLSSTQVTLEAI